MVVDRAGADTELGGDLFRGLQFCEEGQHPAFRRTETYLTFMARVQQQAAEVRGACLIIPELG